MKYVYHHLGLGDHFICNGIVRHYYDMHKQIKLFCKNHLRDNIEFMYRDLKNLEVLSFSDDQEVEKYIYSNDLNNDLIKIGFDKLRSSMKYVETFDQGFYFGQKLPFEIRFEKFYIKRDKDQEKYVYNKFAKDLDQYIFVHDDPDRGMNIDLDKIKGSDSIPIIRNDKSFLITDYLTLLENATEIHLMQSCFKDMINSYVMKKPKIFLHNYIRNYDNFANSVGLNNFEVIY